MLAKLVSWQLTASREIYNLVTNVGDLYLKNQTERNVLVTIENY